jgi:MFS family permease
MRPSAQLTYTQTERATALGWFLSGTLIGPALGWCKHSERQAICLCWPGPFIGGIIVTFRSWRDIFWLQTALAGTAALLCFFLQPETIHVKRSQELEGLSRPEKARKMWQWLNPLRVIKLFRYPNLLLVVRLPLSLPIRSLLIADKVFGIVFTRLEHVLPPYAYSLRSQPTLQSLFASARQSLLHSSRLRIPVWNIRWRALCRPLCEEVHPHTRAASRRRPPTQLCIFPRWSESSMHAHLRVEC